ncbi:MAG TPA: histidinol dehydrogenase, partial [Synechococcales bacterium UBA12195]|nr:histidinol dehydrogenase [Synechococcales bacterium UBA12195]
MIVSTDAMMQLLNDPVAAVDRLRQIEARTHSSGVATAQATVDSVLAAVKERGDAALKEYTERFDGVVL